MASKSLLIGLLLVLCAVPASSEPNKIAEYYSSIIDVGYYYADISIYNPSCYAQCDEDSTLNTVDNAKKTIDSSKDIVSSKPVNPPDKSKTNQDSSNTQKKIKQNITVTTTTTVKATPPSKMLPMSPLDKEENIQIRAQGQQHNLLEYSKNMKHYNDDFHFIIYKEWKLDKSNIFVKQLNEKNANITAMREFYLLSNIDSYHNELLSPNSYKNGTFSKEFYFYNLAYLDFLYYFYDIHKIKESNQNIFFYATLKKDIDLKKLSMYISPIVKIKFNKKYNIPVKFLYLNKDSKPIGSITITEIEGIGNIYYAVAYKITNYHVFSLVKVKNLLIGLSLDLESNSKLRLDEYKDLTKEIKVYENN